jgi:hypothetical protein
MRLAMAPLAHLWLEAAQIIVRVIRAYGATETSRPLFHFIWKPGGEPLVPGHFF